MLLYSVFPHSQRVAGASENGETIERCGDIDVDVDVDGDVNSP